MSQTSSANSRQRRRAILFVLGAAGCFALSAVAVKTLDGAVPLAQVILFRNLFALPALLPLLLAQGGLAALRTSRPLAHALRTLFGLMGMVGAFYGVLHLPLATVTALGFTMPFFLTGLSVMVLRQRVGWRRWSAVGVGFLGVLLMLRPGGALPDGQLLAVGVVLLGSLGWALAMLTIRRLGEAGESGVSIVLWFAIGAGFVSLLFALPVWAWPTPWQWLLLTFIGLISALAQLMMTDAYRRAEPTLLAPFEYSAIIWTTLVGLLVFAEWPDGWDLAGFAVLVGSGLYIWRRETRLGLRR